MQQQRQFSLLILYYMDGEQMQVKRIKMLTKNLDTGHPVALYINTAVAKSGSRYWF